MPPMPTSDLVSLANAAHASDIAAVHWIKVGATMSNASSSGRSAACGAKRCWS